MTPTQMYLILEGCKILGVKKKLDDAIDKVKEIREERPKLDEKDAKEFEDKIEVLKVLADKYVMKLLDDKDPVK